MFKLDFETDSSGPLAGDGGSDRGYRITMSEAVVNFLGGLRRGSDNHGPGRDDSERRNDNERQNDNWDRDNLQDNLRHIAHSTLQVLDDGEYFPPGLDGPYDLKAKILWTAENTRYYGPDTGEGGEILESEFIKINEVYDDDNANPKDQTRVQATVSPNPQKRATLDDTQPSIYIGEYSTLIGARKVYLALATNTDPSVNKKIGVLNFASAKQPGGEFINGSQAQVRFF